LTFDDILLIWTHLAAKHFISFRTNIGRKFLAVSRTVSTSSVFQYAFKPPVVVAGGFTTLPLKVTASSGAQPKLQTAIRSSILYSPEVVGDHERHN